MPSQTKNSFPQKQKGIYNLLLIISILSITKYIIENYKEFGWIMIIPLSGITIQDYIWFLIVMLLIFMRSIISYILVKYSLNSLMTLINILCFEFLVIKINFIKIHHVYLSGWALSVNIIYLAKIASFYLAHGKNIITQKETLNINLKIKGIKNIKNLNTKQDFKLYHFLYFLLVPTLCYYSEYPLLKKRDWTKIIRKLLLFTIGLFLFVFISDQYAIPSIYKILRGIDLFLVLENFINLMISTAILFLIFFQLVFVYGLDILAEMTLFKDKQFYQAWWNSITISQFWTLWNLPVHKWFKRHVYIPLREAGFSKIISQSICFFISAFFHEYVVSISSKKFCGWVFISMMIQVPFIYISDIVHMFIPGLSNHFFWCSFSVIGQPIIVILYYRSKFLLL